MTSDATQPAASGEAQKLFLEFKAEYEKADKLSKEVQTYRTKASIPSINEMRYAGYHLLHAVDAIGLISDVSQITKAKSHAQRACYEASEAGISFALKDIKLFQQYYKDVILVDDIKNYLEILEKVEEAQKSIGVVRQIGDDRQLDHEKHRELFFYLSKAANTLNAARPELNKRMQEARTSKQRWLVTTIIATLALLVATAAFLLNLRNASQSATPPAASTPSKPATPGGEAPPPPSSGTAPR